MKNKEFEFYKSVQLLNYLASKNPDSQINKLKVIKLIWAADRYHLRKYGRPITNDIYIAMKLGPVGSNIKDIADKSQYLAPESLDYANQYIATSENKYEIKSVKDVDMSVFSESNIEALDFALEQLNQFNQFQLADITHEYPEWKKYQKTIENNPTSSIEMDLEDFFGNPDSNDIFPSTTPELLQEYVDSVKTNSLWD